MYSVRHDVRPGNRNPGRTLALTALAATLPVFVNACSSRPEPQAADSQAPAAADILEHAPREWDAFLSWAEKALQQAPPGVALPDAPTLPEPKWSVLRLTEDSAFKRAARAPGRKREAREPQVLAEIGPFRSDTNTPTFAAQIARRATEDGRDALKLIMGGFDVNRDDVGMIELDLTVPFGDYVTLQWTEAGRRSKWSRAGQLLVPVPTRERYHVPVSTSGMVEWEGPLGNIALVTDGQGEGVIQVHRVRFISRADAFPESIGLKNRTRVGRELRPAVYMHGAGRITYTNVLLPDKAAFRSGLAVVSGQRRDREGAVSQGAQHAPASGAVEFAAYVEHDGQSTRLFSRTLMPDTRWIDVSAPLHRWSGENVSLTLEVRTDDPESVALWGAPQVYESVEDPPLLIVYLIDTLAAEHMQLYGYPRNTTPNLTALARRGVWFADMISNSPRTVESIPDLMLSMTTERHGVHHNLTPAPHELVTLAESLQAAGFATSSYITNVYAGPRANMDQGFDHLVDKIGFFWTRDAELADRTIPLTEVLTWLDSHRDRPKFLYIHTAEPHAPYTPPAGFEGRFDPGYRGSVDGSYGPRGFHRAIRNPAQQQRDVLHVASLYDEEILYADARLGLLLKALQDRDLLSKTNLIVTADHGEEFLQHGVWEHGMNLHNEQTYVPLVMVGSMFAAGRRIDVPAQIVDIMPTLLELLDLPQPYQLLGRSLAPLVGPGQSPAIAAASLSTMAPEKGLSPELLDKYRHGTLFGSNHNYRNRGVVEFYAIRDGRWKLIYGVHPKPRFMLFDIQSDRGERNNVLYENRDLARSLIEDLLVWRHSQRPYEADVSSMIDTDQMQQLEALGYVGDKPSAILKDGREEDDFSEQPQPTSTPAEPNAAGSP